MIDYFTLALTHGLIALALWRLAFRPELDEEDGGDLKERRPWLKSASGGETDIAQGRADD